MVTKSRIAVITGLIMSMVLLGAAKCGPGESDSSAPTAHSTVKPFAQPKGPAAVPPLHGGGRDPNDDDFFQPASPPKGAPDGTVTYEVRAQKYNAQAEPIGGLATAFVDAVPLMPAAGGVGPQGAGAWPYNKESVLLPFQLPIFIQPGITVSVLATFNTFADRGEILACWLVGAGGMEIRGTRNDVQAKTKHALLSANCSGNIGT